MWSLVKAEFSYRWWILACVFLIMAFFPTVNSVISEKTRVIVALSYISYTFSFASFLVVIELQNRAKREHRNALLARLPFSVRQRAFIRLAPVLVLIGICLIANVFAYFYLGDLKEEVKIWTFFSSLAWWAAVFFIWIWIAEVLDNSFNNSRFGQITMRTMVIFAWVLIIFFALSFPDLFRNSLYSLKNTIMALSIALMSFLLAWFRLVSKSNLLG